MEQAIISVKSRGGVTDSAARLAATAERVRRDLDEAARKLVESGKYDEATGWLRPLDHTPVAAAAAEEQTTQGWLRPLDATQLTSADGAADEAAAMEAADAQAPAANLAAAAGLMAPFAEGADAPEARHDRRGKKSARGAQRRARVKARAEAEAALEAAE